MAFGLRALLAVPVVVAAAYGGNELASRLSPIEPEKPIIAQLYANPESFLGRRIEIYGLVVENSGGDSFMLQDVSQRPLKVRGSAKAGDQVTVVGTLRFEAGSIFVAAEALRETKVLGGGGCC